MASGYLFIPKRYITGTLNNTRILFSSTALLQNAEKNTDEPRDLVKISVPPLPVPYKQAELIRYAQQEERIMVDKTVDVSLITGVPEEHIKERLVRISKAPKNAMQSGTDNTHTWIMQFETRQRWENPLMGWCSSGDPLSNLQVRFNTADEAKEFCDKNGWEWYVEKEKPVMPKVKSYGYNFSWNKRTRVSTK